MIPKTMRDPFKSNRLHEIIDLDVSGSLSRDEWLLSDDANSSRFLTKTDDFPWKRKGCLRKMDSLQIFGRGCEPAATPSSSVRARQGCFQHSKAVRPDLMFRSDKIRQCIR